MPSTSVHLPADVLEALDRLATESGASRNSLIVGAVREALQRRERRWPPGFFANDHLSAEELEELCAGEVELARTILDGRRSRTAPPF